MLTAHEIIKALLRTEKSNLYEPNRQYLFLVDKGVNKIQIKRAVEEIYKVKVSCVNTFIMPGKLKRVRHQFGKTPDYKKAVVTLKEGHKIETAT
ncbi:MAG: 50S ribosomal protein L23 [Candidatus Omnitrophota bacterium]